MKLKSCASCKLLNTTRTAKFIGRDDGLGKALLYFNCGKCGSTFVISRARVYMCDERICREA